LVFAGALAAGLAAVFFLGVVKTVILSCPRRPLDASSFQLRCGSQ
jgi:hypothetical protein